jgi:hypothetical protein
MKKISLILVLVVFSLVQQAQAQVSVQFNIGVQPLWGPVGYDYVENYYIPDIDAYYYVPGRVYVYYDNGAWVRTSALPPRYRSIDIYNVHKVVINDRSPWTHHDRYRTQYISYRGRPGQAVIRNSHEEKYWRHPGHPEHAKWKANPGHSKVSHGGGHPGRGNGHVKHGDGNPGRVNGPGKHEGGRGGGPGKHGGGHGNGGHGGGNGKGHQGK